MAESHIQTIAQLRRKLRRQLLRDLYHGSPLAGTTLDEINEYYGYQFSPGIYNILMIQVMPRNEEDLADLSDVLAWVDKDVGRFLSSQPFLEHETLPEGDILYCMFHFSDQPNPEILEDVHASIRHLFQHLNASRRYRPYCFSLGEGLPTHSISALGGCFLSARNAVEEYGASQRTNRIRDSMSHMFAMTQIMIVLNPARRNQFSHLLETYQSEQLVQWVEDVFQDLSPHLQNFPTIIYQLPYKIYDLCLETAGKTVALDSSLQDLLMNCRAATDELSDYEEICKQTKNGILQFSIQYAQASHRDLSRPIAEARIFMWENYTHRLTLDEIASHAHLNPQYFSVLFKRETGLSVTEFLATLRIDRSKQLLKDSVLPIYEVARLVSYEDPDYFCRVFRKLCGITPKQYRNASRGNQQAPPCD